MGMQFSNRKGILAEMNVVPLIDILLVLLIVFMVITPTSPFGLPAMIPQPSSPDTPQDRPEVVVVQVLTGGRLQINQEDVTWENLPSRLDTIFKGRAEKVAFIKGDQTVPFNEIARAIGIMRGSDIQKIGLITGKVEVSR